MLGCERLGLHKTPENKHMTNFVELGNGCGLLQALSNIKNVRNTSNHRIYMLKGQFWMLTELSNDKNYAPKKINETTAALIVLAAARYTFSFWDAMVNFKIDLPNN